MNNNDAVLDPLNILVLTKRRYMSKDLIDDRYGRFREIPLELARIGHRVKGLCLSYRQRKEEWIADGPVLWMSVNVGHFLLPGIGRFIAYAKKMAGDADVIWACSDSVYGVIAHYLSAVCNKPFIFDLYDNFEYYLAAKLPIIRSLYRRAVRRCAAVTCISHPLADMLKLYGKRNNIYVLENGVRKDLFKPLDKMECRKTLELPTNCRMVGYVGAIYKNRGIEKLFQAFNQLKILYPDLHFAVAGPRDIRVPRDPYVHDMGILPLERVPVFINALNVSVISINNDSFGKYCYPQKAGETMACDVPLIAAKVGSLKILFNDHPEWLYDSGSVDSLVYALERRLTDISTGYPLPPTWADLAEKLENIMIEVNFDYH